MKVRRSLLGACALGIWLFAAMAVPAFSEIMQQQAEPAAQAPASTSTQTTTLPPQSQQTQGSAPLRVMVGKSLLINTTERLRRISITDDAIAYAKPSPPRRSWFMAGLREKFRC